MESAGQKTSGGESSPQLSLQYSKVIIFQRQLLYWEDFAQRVCKFQAIGVALGTCSLFYRLWYLDVKMYIQLLHLSAIFRVVRGRGSPQWKGFYDILRERQQLNRSEILKSIVFAACKDLRDENTALIIVGTNAEERIIDVCVTSCGSPASSVCVTSYRDKEPRVSQTDRASGPIH